MSDALQQILKATSPLTLASVPSGFLPWFAADLARAVHGTGTGGRAVVIAADEVAMRAIADTAGVFAPEVEVLTLPAWDCLPYDRALFAALLTETDVDIMAWAIGTEAVPDRYQGPMLDALRKLDFITVAK